jgi:hypothetical protein
MVEAMVQGKSIIEFDPDLKISIGIKKIWNELFNQQL